MAKNWSGDCDALVKLVRSTSITGTDDKHLVPHENTLVLTTIVPGAYLIQIKDAGHAIMVQYPTEVTEILNTSLSISHQSN